MRSTTTTCDRCGKVSSAEFPVEPYRVGLAPKTTELPVKDLCEVCAIAIGGAIERELKGGEQPKAKATPLGTP